MPAVDWTAIATIILAMATVFSGWMQYRSAKISQPIQATSNARPTKARSRATLKWAIWDIFLLVLSIIAVIDNVRQPPPVTGMRTFLIAFFVVSASRILDQLRDWTVGKSP